MKRRGAIVEVNFRDLAELIAGEGYMIHFARPSFTDPGEPVFELFVTGPDLPDIEEGMVPSRKRLMRRRPGDDGPNILVDV